MICSSWSRSHKIRLLSISKFFVSCCHSNIGLLKTTFSQFSIHSQLLVNIFFSDRARKKPFLRRLKNIDLASEKLYRNTLKPTHLRNRSILRIFQPGYRLVQMNLHTLWQRYHSELYQGILHLLHKLGFLEKWCIGLHHWTDKSCTGLEQPLLRQKFKS